MDGLILNLTKEQNENVKIYWGPVLGWSYISNKNENNRKNIGRYCNGSMQNSKFLRKRFESVAALK